MTTIHTPSRKQHPTQTAAGLVRQWEDCIAPHDLPKWAEEAALTMRALLQSSATFKLEGKPVDLGGDAFITLLMPIVREASHKMDASCLAQLYAGMLCALYGSLCADFGPTSGPHAFATMVQGLQRLPPMEGAH